VRANLLAALIGILCVAGCGGNGTIAGGGGGGGTTPTGSNVQAITVDSGPAIIANSTNPAVNTAYTTVIVCAPGSTTNCQTIDHIQVDTGSSGLRIIASVLTITLPLQTDANNNVIAECTHFVDGSSWGPLRQADVKIGGETASKQEVQVIGDAAYPTIPAACSGTGTIAENTVTAFGANGILGVGPFIQDCGAACEQQGHAVYFTCPTTTTCADTGMPLTLQVANPVASFATDNNGVIIQLPSVGSTGSAAVAGSLIFGIGTQSNNGLGSATVLMLGGNGELTTNYKQTSLQASFIDSGSNAYYFPDTITTCASNTRAPNFFCPATTLALSASMVSPINGTSLTVNFSVANADSLFAGNSVIAAANDLAAPTTSVNNTGSSSTTLSDSFDWGLPFYFGRSVFTAIETRNTSGGMGPYFAF
jgi:hypothetical protein